MNGITRGINQHEAPADRGVVIEGTFPASPAHSYGQSQPATGIVIAGPGWQDAKNLAGLREALLAAGFIEVERNIQRWAWARAVDGTPLEHALSFEGFVQGKSWIADGNWVKACTVIRGDLGARRMMGPALESIDSSFTTDGISHVAHILQGFRRNELLWSQGGSLEQLSD